MKLKSAPVYVKAVGDGSGGGEFEAIVSVFNYIDCCGDVVLPGAFTDTIEEWRSSDDTMPVLWSHRMDDPQYNIGAVLELDELGPGDPRMGDAVEQFVKDNGGLYVKAQLDTGPDASPIAVQALRLLKARRTVQFSYAYDEIDSGAVTVDGVDAWGLKKIKLHEVSPTQIGANDLTDLVTAKGGLKIGRTLSQSNEDKIRQAMELLMTCLQSIDGGNDTPGKAKREEPATAKREERSRESIRLLTDLGTAEATTPAETAEIH